MELIKEEVNQFFVLVRHFTIRFLNNDILKYEDQKHERVITLMVVLVIAGGVISHQLLFPYLIPRLSGAGAASIWTKKTVFLTVTMAITGCFTALNWQNIFPDSKDYTNLLVLPVKRRTLFTAKFFSLLVVVGFISLAFNVLSVFIFTFYLAEFVQVNIFYAAFTHIFITFLANLFVFIAVACLQGIFSILFKNKWFQRISNALQVIFLFGFISLLFYLPRISEYLPAAKENTSSLFYYFPPLWFTGLYEKMTGSSDMVFTTHVYIIALALILSTGLYLSGFPITCKRFLNACTTGKKGEHPGKLQDTVKHWFNSIFLRHPTQRGIFYFMLHALKRSRFHRLHLVMYMSLPTAYILAQLVYHYAGKGGSYFQTPNMFLAGISLITYFFLAFGLRMIIRHPINLEANWLFQLTETEEKKHYIKGIKKALFFFGGVPVFVLLFIFYVYCWGYPLAVYHSLYSLGIFVLLAEVLFYRYKKIPFAGTHDPGKPNIKLYWPLYAAGFLEGFVMFSSLALLFMRNPRGYIFFFAVVLGLKALLVFRRYEKYKNEDFRFIYEEEPEEVMLSLNIIK
jgi:hypothetical protein